LGIDFVPIPNTQYLIPNDVIFLPFTLPIKYALNPQGHTNDFLEMIRLHGGILHKVSRLYRHEEEDRKDLLQEIVIQVWKSWPQFRGDSKISTWIYRIAINTAIGDFRKKKRTVETIAFGNEPHELVDSGYDYEKEAQLEQLYTAIRQLNEIDRAIVMLYLEEKSYEEMEEILGIKQGNLRVKMNRIKEKLRNLTKAAVHGTG
jgi:RNA polymerase sigma-70 factor (ECF subfamily)